MEGIAAKAGVSKQTIYKWWSTKSALVMEAYAGSFGEFTPAPDSGDFATDLREFTRRSLRTLARPHMLGALTGLLAEAQFDENVRQDMRERPGGAPGALARALQPGPGPRPSRAPRRRRADARLPVRPHLDAHAVSARPARPSFRRRDRRPRAERGAHDERTDSATATWSRSSADTSHVLNECVVARAVMRVGKPVSSTCRAAAAACSVQVENREMV